jgi:uncharacterized Zn finger protein
MSIPGASRTVTCANCGAPAQVVISKKVQGEPRLVTSAEGKFYVTVDCQFCGKVQQEVGDFTTNPVPHNRD